MSEKSSEQNPHDELTELVDEWSQKADQLLHEGSDDGVRNDYVEGRGGQLAVCTDRLRGILDDYEDDEPPRCEVCGEPMDGWDNLTSDSHPDGPNLWACGDCDE